MANDPQSGQPVAADLYYAIGLPPAKAIAYLKSKGYAITWNWDELWQRAHAKAFTVAGVMQQDVLQDIREALDDALANGKTFTSFEDDLKPILQRKGWWGFLSQTDKETGEMFGKGLDPYRLKIIYQTNMQTAYMAGRYKSQIDNVQFRPYWEYVAILDGRTRPTHRALDGKIFRSDDPFWDSFYPPNGFNCRCRVRARSQDDMDEKNLYLSNSAGKLEDVELTVSKRSGKTATVTGYRDQITKKLTTPDVGWSYNPGKAWLENTK